MLHPDMLFSDISSVVTTRSGCNLTALRLESATETTLTKLLNRCPSLQALSICHSSQFRAPVDADDPANRAAEYALYHLAASAVCNLHLHNAYNLCNLHLDTLVHLRVLQFEYIGPDLTNDGVLQLATRNPLLHRVSLVECTGLKGDSLILPFLQRCSNLHTFNFSSQHRVMGSADKLLLDAIRFGFPNIKALSISLV